jgi:hypothetical protein
MTPGPALLEAIESAYAKFATYGQPGELDASPLRDAKAILATLTSAPLRELTGQQIGPYAGWALTTVGSVEDYKHFLPRILEQAVRAPEWMGTFPQIVAARLKRAHWRDWPVSEQKAIATLFRAAWDQASEEHPGLSGVDAAQWLCALAALGEDIHPLLLQWIERPGEGAVLQIAKLVLEIPAITSPDPFEQIFWVDVDAEARLAVAQWLTSSEVEAVLNAAAGVGDEDMWSVREAQKALQKHAGEVQH